MLFMFILSALYRMRICYVLWGYVNMKESRSTCSGCMGGPGRLLPPPLLRCRSRGGGGSWRAGSCLGSWAGKGGSLPCELGGSHSRVYMANLYGRFIRQIYMATLYGGFVWRVKWAHLFKIESKKTLQSKWNRKEWNILWWICNCNIIM